MEKPAETSTPNENCPNEDKHSFNWGWIVWPLVILLFYVLSSGPAARIAYDGPSLRTRKFIDKFYAPVGWAYGSTFLHKPLGMYFHLWAPKVINKSGEFIGE